MKFFTLQLTDISFYEAVLIALLGFFLVIIVLAVLAVFVRLLSKVSGSMFGSRESKNEAPAPLTQASPVSAPVIAPTPAPAPVSAPEFCCSASGCVYLERVSEKEAAVIMAICSSKTGIPLERLSFSSIKRLDKTELSGISDREAACVMAITANRLNKPLENLDFKSIKLLEE